MAVAFHPSEEYVALEAADGDPLARWRDIGTDTRCDLVARLDSQPSPQAAWVLLRSDARTRAELETRQGWVVNAARLAVAAPWAVLLLLGTQSQTLTSYDSAGGSVLLSSAAGMPMSASWATWSCISAISGDTTTTVCPSTSAGS